MKSLLILALLLGLLAPCSVMALEFRVNDDLSNNEQLNPKTAVSRDRFTVVWTDNRRGHSDAYYQSLDNKGNLVELNRRLNDDMGNNHQSDIAVASSSMGGFTSIWIDYRNGQYPFASELYLQKVDSILAPAGANLWLSTEPADTLLGSPDIALWADNSGVVVWADFRRGNWDIAARLLNSNGQPIGASFQVNDDPGNAHQHAPRVSVAPDGWFVVTWYDNRFGSDDVFVQLFDREARKKGVNFRVNSDGATARQSSSDVACDGEGHFTVVWVDWRNGQYPQNSDIYARKLDTMLSPSGAEFRVNRDGTTRSQRDPAIAADHRGNVAIVWSDSTSNSWDIVGQMIDADGLVRESQFDASTDRQGEQVYPDVSLDGHSRCISWMDNREANWDIYASVSVYNSPKLLVSPTEVIFSWRDGEEVPEGHIDISHAGYNSIGFNCTNIPLWLSVSPMQGVTPESLRISLDTAGITDSLQQGSFVIAGTTTADTVRIFVTLRTLPPALLLSPDSVTFNLNLAIDSTPEITVSLQSSNSQPANWRITTLPEWALITALSGTTPQSLELTVDRTRVTIGAFHDDIVFETTGPFLSFDTLEVALIVEDESTGILVNDQEPSGIKLHQNSPNPANPNTTINFELDTRRQTVLEVFNLLGQHIVTLVDKQLPAGIHTVDWNGRDRFENEAPTGLYFYRLTTGTYSRTRKLLLLK